MEAVSTRPARDWRTSGSRRTRRCADRLYAEKSFLVSYRSTFFIVIFNANIKISTDKNCEMTINMKITYSKKIVKLQ